MTGMMLAALVDWGALLEVAVVALVAGAGVVIVFSFGLVGVSEFEAHRGQTRAAAGMAAAVVCFVLCLAAVAYGIVIMMNKTS